MLKKFLLLNLLILIAFSAGSSFVAGQTADPKLAVADPNDIEFVRARFSENGQRIAGMMWSLTHNYSDKAEVDKVMEDLIGFLTALQTSDPEAMKKLGGPQGIKEKFAAYTKSGDSTIRGFSAIILAIFGDKKYVPAIEEILTADFKFKDDLARMTETSKGQAAIALSMLGATEYEGKVLELLKTGNDFNRDGAITALIRLGGKKHAKAVVDLMLDKNAYALNKLAPLNFLLETGAALDHKKELIGLLHSSFDSEQRKAIMFLFVRLDAKDTKLEIAKLLNVDYVKGEAAKGLAIMGATEYEDKIALLLSDENSLVRKDAALALGILKSVKYAGAVSKLLLAKEDFVRLYAAISLIMMDAKPYLSKALPVVDSFKQQRVYLNMGNFHPFVVNRAQEIIDKFDSQLETARTYAN